MSAAAQTGLGALIVLVTAWDVFASVLLGRAGGGILMPRLNRAIWVLLRTADRTLHAGGRLMGMAGPTMLVINTALWSALLVAGFALIYWPLLGSELVAASGPTDTGFTSALYYSGFNFSTLGLGDIAPQTPAARILTVVEAATGFAFFTLVISYTLNIYQAVQQRDAFALLLDAGADGGDPVQALLGLLPGGSPADDVGSSLTGMADGATRLLEAHHAYRIAHFYRRRDPGLAMPRILYQLLELVTLAESELDPAANDSLVRSRGFVALRNAAHRMLREVDDMLVPASFSAAGAVPHRRGPVRPHLTARGVSLRAESDAQEIYEREAARWRSTLCRMNSYMAYPPQVIEPTAEAVTPRRG